MAPQLIPYGDEVFFGYTDGMKIICKKHMMEMDELVHKNPYILDEGTELSRVRCLEGHVVELSKKPSDIREFISRKINSKRYQDAKIFEIDGYLVPASKEAQIKTAGTEYFITAQVKNGTKKGDQVIIYAGKKGSNEKVQIFIDPENAKMTFDQNDINPTDIFMKLEATFRNGSRTTIERTKEGVSK